MFAAGASESRLNRHGMDAFPPRRTAMRFRFPPLLSRCVPCCLACWALVVPHECAAQPAAESNVVALPPFIVEEAHKGPPWRYAEITGFEVLSRCSDSTTQKILQAYHRLHRLLTVILPEELQVKFAVPKALIFYDEELQPAASREVVAQMMRNQPPPPVEMESGNFGGRNFRITPPSRRYSFVPNLRLFDRDAMTVFSIVRAQDFDGEHLVLTPDYIGYLLKSRVPALPPWFVSGLLTLYRQTKFSGNEVVIEPLDWFTELKKPGAAKPDPALPDAPPPPPPPPAIALREFFAGEAQPSASIAADPAQIRQAQCALLVRWALDRKDDAARAALWKLVGQVSTRVIDEPLFQECFGLDFATAQAQLDAYLPKAVKNSARLRPAQTPRLPAVALRNATENEIARIKGDWERMEIAYVKTRSPELVSKYVEQARRTLMRAYDHGDRDRRLLALLGLCECDAGNDAGAREFLEAAAEAGEMRPRAAFELARLRFAEFRATPGAPEGKLNSDQAARVLTPLFAARAQPTPQPEIYELIGEVWWQCAVKPTRGHLAILDEGIRLFPYRTALILRTATLYAVHGYPTEALALANLGLQVTTDANLRERLTKLQATLQARTP